MASQTLESTDMYSLESVEPLFHHMFAQSCLCVVLPAYGHGEANILFESNPLLTRSNLTEDIERQFLM